MKVLVNIPKVFGGVSHHYWGLYPYWSEDVRYNTIGRRSRWRYSGLFWLPWDIIKFVSLIVLWRPDRIVINPSFGYSAMARDLVFLHMGKFLHKIVIVFIHGWDMRYAENVNRRVVSRLNNAGCLIVLAEEFKKSLIGMGLTIPIYIMTTKVDDRLLQNFDINKRTGEINTLLFLASVQRKKGIFTLIGAYGVLKRKYANLCLNIVGDGTALNEAIDYVADNDIQGVLFTGRLDGQELADQFVKSDIYILPTHGEGMPASVLEAMAFGLPVITRPVGGLVDFFTPSMGSLVESLNPGDYVSEIERYITNPRLTKSISIYNYQFAKENFLASSVARKFENIFAILNGNRNS